MAAEHQYFYEDEVFRINKKGNIEFGMVIETSELASSDENSDVEEGGRMKKDHIRVAWHPSGLEEVIPEKKVHLADRSLMPGDVVRRLIKGKDTQRGYCRDIKVLACVQVVGTKQVIANVKSEHLTPLEEFATDIVACMDSWVGSIKTVHSKVVLRCPDGSRCITNDIEALGLEDFKERRDCECDLTDRRDEFYPGQILYGPLHVLEDAEWLHQTKEVKSQLVKSSKMVKVAVEEVRTDSVGIHWQCRAYSKEGAGLDKEQPKFLLQGDDLKKLRLLNVFEPCTLQVGDRNFYTLREADTVTTREQWRRSQRDTLVAVSLSNGIKVASPKRVRCKPSGGDDAVKKSPLHSVSETIGGHETNMHAPEVMLTVANDDAEWDTEGTGSMSDTTSISSNCSSISSQGKKKKGPALMTKVLKKKKLRRAKKKVPALPLVPGFRVVVETLSTSSIADVVWQDGSVEMGIPSTQLYPIHHLDDQEFFPGDFVIENRDDSCMRVYGVVQSVDHAGRTATIKWFKTYTSQEEPQPAQLGENEVSVYDLKDHPDFQYRPGTVVIRVANFEGEDANCTAGQVLDNYPEGMVRVWWVDDHVSMCWPQDLYKVGEYDSDEGELWDDASSDGSWETESEDCFIADDVCLEEDVEKLLRPKLAANIEKARIAMSRLEEIFTQNPSLSTAGVMRQLLDVYKDCRYLDKLMGTSFFHESHFQGLLERVRERGRANVAQRVADQVSRLFHDSNDYRTSSIGEPGSVPEDSGLSSTEISTKDSNGSSGNESFTSGAFFLNENLASLERRVTAASNHKKMDSGGVESTRTACAISNGHVESPEVAKSPTSPPVMVSNSHVCVKLCSLIKAQLVKAHAEVTRRFGGHQGQMTLSEAFKTHSPVEEGDEEKVASTVLASSEDTGGQPQPLLEKVKDGIMDVFNVIVRLKTNTVPNGDEVVEDVQSDAAVSTTTISEETPAGKEYEEGFSIMDSAPSSHKFKLTMFQPTDPQNFFKTVRKEIKLLGTSLPRGIWVKGFEDRMDLYSVMVRGPENTPYEDGLFFFDFQLSAEYPKAPPLCHYISYCSDRLNPNLYEDGKVCVSLLGTWSGKGTEVWTSTSNLLQVIVSIQGLILVSEPYFNEAGYEKQKGSQQGKENSRMYNEMAVLKLVQAQTKLILTPPPIFKEEIMVHFRHNAYKLIQRLESWLEISERYNSAHPITPTSPTSFRELHGHAISEALNAQLPEFPLIPASKGFCLTLRKSLLTFRETLASVGITGPS